MLACLLFKSTETALTWMRCANARDNEITAELPTIKSGGSCARIAIDTGSVFWPQQRIKVWNICCLEWNPAEFQKHVVTVCRNLRDLRQGEISIFRKLTSIVLPEPKADIASWAKTAATSTKRRWRRAEDAVIIATDSNGRLRTTALFWEIRVQGTTARRMLERIFKLPLYWSTMFGFPARSDACAILEYNTLPHTTGKRTNWMRFMIISATGTCTCGEELNEPNTAGNRMEKVRGNTNIPNRLDTTVSARASGTDPPAALLNCKPVKKNVYTYI